VGDEIVPHLIGTDLPVVAAPPLVRYRKVSADLAPYLDTWDPSFKDWGAAAVPHDARYLRLTRYEDAGKGAVALSPRAPRFGGKVFVLVGPANSSATFQFAEQVQQSGLVKLVGQPTGGNRRGINGGAFFFLRLPNSGIELDVPLIARFPAANPPDARLLPDLPVTPTVEDIVAGKDAELVAVRKHLQIDGGKR